MALSKAQKAARAATAAAAAAAADKNTKPDDAPATAKKREFKSEGSMGPKIRAPVVHDQAKAGGGRTVVVVCKMPRGLMLQHHTKVKQDQKVMGGGIEKREVAMAVGEPVRLKPATLAFGLIPNYTIVNGFSFTHVDANFWNTWYQQNENFGMLKAGLLCAFDNEPDATAYCKEYGSLKHGLEPLAQKDDPRVEQPTSQNLSALDIDTDAPAARS
jgi:hypothetical protein